MNTQNQNNLFDTSIYTKQAERDFEIEQISSKKIDPAWDNGEAFPKFLEESFKVGSRLWFGDIKNQCIVISTEPVYKVRFWHGEEMTAKDLSLFKNADDVERVLMVGDRVKVPMKCKIPLRKEYLICNQGIIIDAIPKTKKYVVRFDTLPLEPEEVELCSDYLTYVREWEQDFLLQACNSEDLRLPDSQKSTNTVAIDSKNCIQESTTTEISNPLPTQEDGDLSLEESTSLPLPHPASLSASKESEKQPPTTETAFPHSSELSATTNQDISALKMSPDCSTVPTTQDMSVNISSGSLLNFTAVGTMQNGYVSQADTLPVPLIEKDCCWLPAPTALSHKKGRPPGLNKLETFLKQKELINKKEVLNPVILCEWYEIPQNWLDPSESRTAAELLENNAAQQEIYLIHELEPLPSEESCTSNRLAPDKPCPQCGTWLNFPYKKCDKCGWIPENFLEESKPNSECGRTPENFLEENKHQFKVGETYTVGDQPHGCAERVRIISHPIRNDWVGVEDVIKEVKDDGWINLTDKTIFYEWLEKMPENFLEEKRKSKKRKPAKKRRNKKGCLYKYLENKKLKDGRIASYPRITSDFRDPENPYHWRWGYNWDEKIDGEWKGRSIGSIPPGVVGFIQDMRMRNLPIEEIISFIRRAKRKK